MSFARRSRSLTASTIITILLAPIRLGPDDTGVISIGLVNLKDHLGHPLSAVESEWITASLSCGALVGALLAGPLADKWGRKAVLLIADAWFVIGAILTAAAYSVPQMIVRAPSIRG